MARPKKELENLRLHQVNIRLNYSEFQYATERASQCGLTVANWIRATSFNSKAPAVKKPLVYKELYSQLSHLGGNVNRLTKLANQGVVMQNDLEYYFLETYNLLKTIQILILNQ